MFEVFFVESGAGVMKIDGAQQQLLPGVCIVVEPGEEHEITNSGDCELVLNYFGLVP
jgi:mannose-6-phosphate isomerase-like protein (cupin superfamily)